MLFLLIQAKLMLDRVQKFIIDITSIYYVEVFCVHMHACALIEGHACDQPTVTIDDL